MLAMFLLSDPGKLPFILFSNLQIGCSMLKPIKSLSFLFAFFVVSVAQANIIVDTSLWTLEDSPARGGAQGLTSSGSNQAVQNNNANGSIISNFSLTGDFTFDGILTPTTSFFDDDDILGVVFGWQDADNHYRLGWEQGGLNDRGIGADGRLVVSSGMFLVREVAGVSTILFQQEIFWQDDVDYNFSVGRNGDDISFSLGGINRSFTDTSFTSGRVGFYTESQTARFSGLASRPVAPAAVPEPSAIALLGLAFTFLFLRRRAR